MLHNTKNKILNKNDIVIGAIEVIIGGIFIYAGLGKIIYSSYFVSSLDKYRLIPEIFHSPISIIIPLIEIVFGLLLLLNIEPSIDSIVLGLLTMSFTVIIGLHYIMGIRIDDCGCFTQAIITPKAITRKYYEIGLMVRNVFIIMMCVIIYKYSKKIKEKK